MKPNASGFTELQRPRGACPDAKPIKTWPDFAFYPGFAKISSYQEIHSLPPFRDHPLFRIALIGALAASLALAGCGRKGPLDPPPGASLEGVPQANMPDLMSGKGQPAPIGGHAKDGYSGVDENGQPMAPKGPRKRIPLDVLLN